MEKGIAGRLPVSLDFGTFFDKLVRVFDKQQQHIIMTQVVEFYCFSDRS